jgi:hypothetical protein
VEDATDLFQDIARCLGRRDIGLIHRFTNPGGQDLRFLSRSDVQESGSLSSNPKSFWALSHGTPCSWRRSQIISKNAGEFANAVESSSTSGAIARKTSQGLP